MVVAHLAVCLVVTSRDANVAENVWASANRWDAISRNGADGIGSCLSIFGAAMFGLRCLGFGCALLVRLDFTNDVPKVLDVHLQGHSLGELLSGDAGSRNVLHSRGNLD